MPCSVVVGGQWGDEGKAKIVDYLTIDADYVVRYQGGANAGHTVVKNNEKFVFHLIPSGILYPEKICVIGNGVVLDPFSLLDEITKLKGLGYDVKDRLKISESAHIIMPYHKIIDIAREKKHSKNKIGTTGRGIGPCYVDKAGRVGIRLLDLYEDDFKFKLEDNIKEKNFILKNYYNEEELSFKKIYDDYLKISGKISEYIDDVPILLNSALDNGKYVLMEGAQGTGLDIDFGTYPFVTSSSPTAGGACIGTGVGPSRIDRVYGIMKAYITRVGEGPFPTEQLNETGNLLREEGGEYGATTGRPRRCGWFDCVFGQYSGLINGFTDIVMTKMDIFDKLNEIDVCTNYEIDGEKILTIPKSLYKLEKVKPIYKTLKGWNTKISNITDYDKLPSEAKDYISFIESSLKTKISIVSVGQDRNATIRR